MQTTVEFYKIFHILGLMLLFIGLAVTMTLSFIENPTPYKKAKTIGFLTHGVGLLLLLISGFGMAGKLGVMSTGMPHWIMVKLVIWILMGGQISLAKRKGYLGWPVVIIFCLFGVAAAYLGIYKLAP